MNIKMYTAAREATTRARNVASAIQQVQRQVNDDNKDIMEKVDKNQQIRSKRKAELELASAATAKRLAQRQLNIANLQAAVATVQTIASVASAIVGKFIDNKNKEPRGTESANPPPSETPTEENDPSKRIQQDAEPPPVETPVEADKPENAVRQDAEPIKAEEAERQPDNATNQIETPQENQNVPGRNTPETPAVDAAEVQPEITPENGIERPAAIAAVAEDPAAVPPEDVAEGATDQRLNTAQPADVTGTGVRDAGTARSPENRGTTAVTDAERNPTEATTPEQSQIEKIQAPGKALGDAFRSLGLKKIGGAAENGPGFLNADPGDGLAGAIAQILVQLIEAARKAAGFEASGGMFEGITKGLGQLGEALTTGSYDTGKKDAQGNAIRKDLNDFGQFLKNGIVDPVQGALSGARDAVAGGLTAASESTTGQGRSVEGVASTALSDQVEQATSKGSFSAADENAFRTAATTALEGQNGTDPTKNLTGPQIQERVDAAVNSIRAGLIEQNTSGLQIASSAEGVTVNGVTLSDDLAKDLTSGDLATRQQALGTLNQAAASGLLAADSGVKTLGRGGAITAGTESGDLGKVQARAQSVLTGAGVSGVSVVATDASNSPTDGVVVSAPTAAGAAANVTLSGQQLAQIETAKGLGLQVSVTAGQNGAAEVNFNAPSATTPTEGQATPAPGAALSGDQVQQLAALQAAGVSVVVSNGGVQIGGASGLQLVAGAPGQAAVAKSADGQTAINAANFNALATVAQQAGAQGLNGLSISVAANGVVKVGNTSASDLSAQAQTINAGTGQAVAFNAGGVTVAGVGSSDGKTQNNISGALATAAKLGLDTTGARVVTGGGVELRDGRVITQDSNDNVTITSPNPSTSTSPNPPTSTSSNQSSLTINGSAIRAINNASTLAQFEGGRLERAVQAGLALSSSGAGNVTLNFDPNARSADGTGGERNRSVQLSIVPQTRDVGGNIRTGANTPISLDVTERIASGQASAGDLNSLGIADQGTQALVQLAGRGVNVTGATVTRADKSASGAVSSIVLKNGASIDGDAAEALANGNSTVSNAVRALGAITRGPSQQFQNLTVQRNGEITSGADTTVDGRVTSPTLSGADISAINQGGERGQALIDQTRANTRGTPVSSVDTTTPVTDASSSPASTPAERALLALGGGTTPLSFQTTGFRSESSRRFDAAQSGVGAVTAGPTRAAGQFVDFFRGIGQRVGLVNGDTAQDLESGLKTQAVDTVAGRVTATDLDGARTQLRDLGFSDAQSAQIATEDRDGNVSINRGAIEDVLSVTRSGETAADGSNQGLNFTVSIQGSSQPALGGVAIANNGTLSALPGAVNFADAAQGLTAGREGAAATALDAQVQALGLNNLRVSGVALDDAGEILSINVQGGRTLSASQFSDEISRASGQNISADKVREVGRDGFKATPASDAVGGSSVFTNSLRTGGASGGFNQAVTSALDNLKRNGINTDNARITSDGNGGVTLDFANPNQRIAISSSGKISVGGQDLVAGPGGQQARDNLATLSQPTRLASGRELSAAQRVDNIVANSSVLDRIASASTDAFSSGPLGGLIGAKAKEVTAIFDNDGRVSGANVKLNDNSALQLGLNTQTGQVGITGFQNAEGRASAPTGRAVQLLTELRRTGLTPGATDGSGGITGILNGLGATDINFSSQDNTRNLQRDDKNAFNNRFDQEGRVQFTLNAGTPQQQRLNLGIAFDKAGGVSLNTENLSSGQRAAITAAVNKGRPLDQQLGEPEALAAFSRSFGGGQFGLGSIQDDQGRLITDSTKLSDEQKQNRTNFVGQIRDAENATIQALTSRTFGGLGQEGVVNQQGANVRFASLNVRALLGDNEALGLIGDDKIGDQTNRQLSAQFLQKVKEGKTEEAQAILDSALVASGLQAGSIKVDELTQANNSTLAADNFTDGILNAKGAQARFGSVDVQVGFDGRTAQITAANISVQGAAGPDGRRTEDQASFSVNQNTDGTRTIDVDSVSGGINRGRLQAAVTEQLPTNERTGTEKVGDALNSITGYLGVGLEAALPGLQALKKALEDMEEARIRLEAAKKQFAAALDYAQKIGLTYGHSTGGDPATSIIAEGHVLGDMIDGAGQSLDGFVNGLNDFLKFGNGSDDNDTGGAGGADAPPVGSLLAQQDGQAQLLQMVSSDANFANIAVLLGQNPGLLIQQAQQMDMLEQLANVIDQLQSPFGNPVQEMQRFVEQLQQRQSEGMVPADGMQVLGG